MISDKKKKVKKKKLKGKKTTDVNTIFMLPSSESIIFDESNLDQNLDTIRLLQQLKCI